MGWVALAGEFWGECGSAFYLGAGLLPHFRKVLEVGAMIWRIDGLGSGSVGARSRAFLNMLIYVLVGPR